MKENRLTIIINKPVRDVFAFVIDPKNTPEWIESVATEEASEWPPKIGTKYRDHDKSGECFEYEVTEFEQDKMIVLSQDWGYHERLTFRSLDFDTTELEYLEWADNDELPELTPLERLEKLKVLAEAD